MSIKTDSVADTPLAYCVKDAAKVVGIGRTKLYELIGKGAVQARRLGGRTVILRRDLEALLDAAEPLPAKNAKAARGGDAAPE